MVVGIIRQTLLWSLQGHRRGWLRMIGGEGITVGEEDVGRGPSFLPYVPWSNTRTQVK